MTQSLLLHTFPSAASSPVSALTELRASQMVLVVKNTLANAGDIRDKRQDLPNFSESGRSPGGGRSSPLQYSCLVNPMERGA